MGEFIPDGLGLGDSKRNQETNNARVKRENMSVPEERTDLG